MGRRETERFFMAGADPDMTGQRREMAGSSQVKPGHDGVKEDEGGGTNRNTPRSQPASMRISVGSSMTVSRAPI
jgi:hypothetical protein